MTVCLSVSIFVQPLCATVIVCAVAVTQNSHVAFNQFSLAGYPNFTLLLLTAPLPLSPEYPTSTGPKCFDECVSKWDFEREAPSAARDVKQLSFVKSGRGPRGFASLPRTNGDADAEELQCIPRCSIEKTRHTCNIKHDTNIIRKHHCNLRTCPCTGCSSRKRMQVA